MPSESRSIAIVEMYRHVDLILALIRLLRSEGWQIHLYTNESNIVEIHSVIKSDFTFYSKKDSDPIFSFLEANEENIRKQQVILITTIFSDYKSWASLNILPSSILIVHNLNAFYNQSIPFRTLLTLPLTVFPGLIWRNLTEYLSLQFLYKKEIRKKVKAIFCLRPSLYLYSQKNIPLISGSIHAHLNTIYTCGILENKYKNNCIKIMIPGTITHQGKDYNTILLAIREIRAKLQEPIELILLGSIDPRGGHYIINQFKELESSMVKIVIYDSYISREVYEAELLKADFMILPIAAYKTANANIEYYNKTTISGIVIDAIFAWKPSLISQHNEISPDYPQGLFSKYRDVSDLSNQISQWIRNKTYKEILNKMDPHEIERFSVLKVGNYLSDLLMTLAV